MKLFRYFRFWLGGLLAGACFVSGSPARAAGSDEQVIAACQAETARLQREIYTAGGDMARIEKLQKQMQELMTETMGKVSPKSRTILEVSMKVINPLIQGGIVYSGEIQKFKEAGGFDYTSATSAEMIDRRLAQLAGIESLNEDLRKRALSLDADIEAVLKASDLSAGEKAGFLKGFQNSSGGRMGAMRAVRTLDANLYVEMRGIYGQLREQLGKWSVKEGKLSFEDGAQVAIYNARLERITVIAQRQDVAQRRALGVK
jgi:hypothetical protein